MNDDEQKINTCDEEKDLGITCNKMLSFDLRIQNVTNKAKQMIGLIKRTFTYLNKVMFIKMCKAQVRSQSEYVNIIWYPYLKRQSVAVEQVHRRATRLLEECKEMSYEERLKYLKLHSLKGRRLGGDLIETYKIFN